MKISVVDLIEDGVEIGRKNYPCVVSLMCCGFNDCLFTYVDGSGVLNTVRVNMDKHCIEIYK